MAASVTSHVFRALRQAIGRVFVWFLLAFVVTALIVEVVAFVAAGHHYPPTTLTHVAAIAMGIAFGYAAGLTVLVVEVVRLLVKSVQDLERDVRGEAFSGAKVIETVIENVEKRL